ncbi:hypothetical protein ACFLYR_02405 [Chloroflexota bacterium]
MEGELAIINQVIEWHQSIRAHVKLAGDAISDREALTGMETAHIDWIPGQTEKMAEKHDRLQQELSLLGDGLNNHFAFEEKVLPPLLGELFMRALTLDHQAIKREIEAAKSTLADNKLEGVNREELLLTESNIQEAVNNVCQLVEEHATREEIMLGMLKRALQDKGPNKSP